MLKASTEYSNAISTSLPDCLEKSIKTFTFQVTEACSLCCTYCYQGNKSTQRMTFETAKAAIDYLFLHRKDPEFYFGEATTRGLIIEFIGGEPLLEIKLIRQIVEYLEDRFLETPDCPWSALHRYSISSNGVAYFDEEVQDFLKEYGGVVSIGITVDGCKELHDKCRLFPDGSGSYDLALRAAIRERNKGNFATKITLSPENISYVYAGVTNMLENGFWCIHINPAFEEGWQPEHATELYYQLKRVADYIVANDLTDKCYVALFDPIKYQNKVGTDDWDKNWCGTVSSMLSLDRNGDLYTCIRFMPSSLGADVEAKPVGNLTDGIANTPQTKAFLDELNGLTKSEQSTSECLACPVESGCAWCTAYNYQRYGTIARRATFICGVHKAAALAAKYFAGVSGNKEDYAVIGVNEEIAKGIIPPEEWEHIASLMEGGA